MTSWVVADSGIMLATVLVEPYSANAKALVAFWKAQNMKVAAPSLFHYEIVAVLRKHVYRGTISQEKATTSIQALLETPVQLFMDIALLKRAYELATQFNRPTAYDSQYLAVAEHLNCEFWTTDEKLFNSVNSQLPWIKWIRNFVPPLT
jgi:predicted nucleic acid-binding protein